MLNPKAPDLSKIMAEIESAAREIEERPVLRSAIRRRARRGPVEVRDLEDNWDVWAQLPVETHRGWKGLPIVLVKRALLSALRPHNRELLKRQREFNRVLKGQVSGLKHQVAELNDEVKELRAMILEMKS